MLRGDGIELGDAGAVGQLPKAEGIADDYELSGLRSRCDFPQELDELVLKLALGKSPVATDVEVTDEVVGRRRERGNVRDPASVLSRVSLPNSRYFRLFQVLL